MARKICYVSGTRADFGLMESTLHQLDAHPDIDLSIVATCMHLSADHGLTINDIKRSGFHICAEIPVDLSNNTRAEMAKSIGHEIIAMTDVFAREQPDIILLLGDRGEMLAAAIAAIHLNIHVAHIHGGERSGTVDELVRHAISKLAHFHFTATEQGRERLIKMGENPNHIMVSGAPGLDAAIQSPKTDKNILFSNVNFNPNRPTALLIYHPIVQEHDDLPRQIKELMQAAIQSKLQLICLTPNADAGGLQIKKVLEEYKTHKDIRLYIHMARQQYLSWLNAIDLMLGNSSSAIIEAASFNLMAVNIGSRQNLREQSNNIIDTDTRCEAIQQAITQILNSKNHDIINRYGDGHAGERICKALLSLELKQQQLNKVNAY